MLKKKLVILGLISACTVMTPALAKETSLQDLQDLPSATKPMVVVDQAKVFTKDHWAYKTLENISKKYGMLVGNPKEKFNINKPLTRSEAAVILVSLVGKIDQNKIELTEVEKDRIDILRQELSNEITVLTGRVATLETSVDSLKGRVSNVEDQQQHVLKMFNGKNFKLEGSIQAAFNEDIAKGLASSSGNTKADLYPTSNNFSIPVADLRLSGNPVNHLNYMLQLAPYRPYATTAGAASKTDILGDAYLSTDIIPHHTVYLGQTRVPLGYEGTLSPLNLDTIARSQISRATTGFGDVRDMGVKIAGNWPMIDYFGGAYNGSNQNGTDANRNLDVVGWATIKPFYKHPKWGKLELGAGDWAGKSGAIWDNTGVPQVSNNTVGYYLGYVYKKFQIRSEYEERTGYTGFSSATTPTTYVSGRKANGWYIMPSYYVTPKLQLVAKFDTFDPNTSTSHNNYDEYTIGSNYYFKGNNLKLQTDLVYADNHLASRNSVKLVVQTQYSF